MGAGDREPPAPRAVSRAARTLAPLAVVALLARVDVAELHRRPEARREVVEAKIPATIAVLERDADARPEPLGVGSLAALHDRTGGEDLWPAVEGSRPYAVACIRGGRSPYVREADVRRLVAAGCPVDTVDGAGHFLHVDAPGEVTDRLLARLA